MKVFPYPISASVSELCKQGRKHGKKMTKTNTELPTLSLSIPRPPSSIKLQYTHATAVLQKYEKPHTQNRQALSQFHFGSKTKIKATWGFCE